MLAILIKFNIYPKSTLKKLFFTAKSVLLTQEVNLLNALSRLRRR